MTADAEPTSDPMVALACLLAATERGEIDQLGERHEIDLLGVFGSAVRRYRDETTPMPRDVDISVSFAGQPRLLKLIDDLVRLTGYEHVDVAVLNQPRPESRGPDRHRPLPTHPGRVGDSPDGGPRRTA